jgi:hypothetical protein
MEVGKTSRGFAIVTFKDRYGIDCSLQKSSLATEEAIWFGCDKADPKELVPGGWKSIPMPDVYVANTRMHLTQDQVRELLPFLQKFVETGEIE